MIRVIYPGTSVLSLLCLELKGKAYYYRECTLAIAMVYVHHNITYNCFVKRFIKIIMTVAIVLRA